MEHTTVYVNNGGVRRTMISDDDQPGIIRVYTEVEMSEVVEEIKRLRDNLPSKSVTRHIARVPMTVYEKSILEDWGDDDWKKWLNDPDNAAFRVWRGRV